MTTALDLEVGRKYRVWRNDRVIFVGVLTKEATPMIVKGERHAALRLQGADAYEGEGTYLCSLDTQFEAIAS